MRTARTRKFFGMAALLAALVAYTLAVVYIAVEFLPDHWAVEIVFYTFFGIIWAFPAKYALIWMHAPDAAPASRD